MHRAWGPPCSSWRAILCVAVAAILGVAATLVFLLARREADIAASAPGGLDPAVDVEQGRLRGHWVRGATGGGFQYAAFRWIPYAEPPLGPLRFKEPRPPLRWEGVRDATREGEVCFQQPLGGQAFTGSEDCLILNVFTPQLPAKNSTLLPVMFFIFGGALSHGSPTAKKFGPDYLVAQDVVVVTVAHRVNVFGFLCFENDAVPGNAGLKDVIEALRWVRRNIHVFGGDPNRVTVEGSSSGASLAHWLTLLPEAEGLLRGAILTSGSPMLGLEYTENNLQFARKFGEALVGPGAGLEETSRRAMEAPPEQLLQAAFDAASVVNVTTPGSMFNELGLQLGVCAHRNLAASLGESRVVTRDPESYVISRASPSVPILMGFTNREWLMYWYNFWSDSQGVPNADSMDSQIKNLISSLPLNIIPFKDTQKILGIEKEVANFTYDEIASYLKERLFDQVDQSCDKTCKLKKYQDMIHMNMGMARLARLRAQLGERTYLYKFAVKTEYNYRIPGETPEEEKTAAVHGDEGHYLFLRETVNSDFNGNSLASKTMRRLVKMWTNFVKTLDPTPELNDLEVPVKWDAYEVTDSGGDTFLHIGENLEMRREYITGEDMPFWLNLYRTYRANRSV